MNFTVHIEPSGHEFSVRADETVLDAALRQSIGLPYGCRNGGCGSCVGKLIDGTVEYPSGKTEALQDQSNGSCLLCQAVPRSDLRCRVVEIEQAEEIPPRILPCRVDRKEQLAHDVVRLYLKLPDGQRLQFLAGQYLDFILQDGRRRAFSIANAPHDDAFIELHIRHVGGGEFTDHVFSAMREKEILRIQAPLGRFTLREDSTRPLIFMAGGTGFAPIKGIIEHALHTGERRPMHLYWGVRSRRDLYLPELPARWSRQHSGFRFVPVLSEPDTDWSGRIGFVHQAVLQDHPDMSGFDVYMAGPPIMVTAGRDAFHEAGLALRHMYSDAFEYAADTPRREPD
jgi:CDP-4-dehydro-6-deoxyglucose reductase